MKPEETALLVELAGTEGECGPEHGKGQYGLPAPKWCSRCHGTGKVFVLPDSVRVPCSCSACYALGHAVCGCCGGRRWTASLDFVQWCWALAKVGVEKIEIDLQTGAVQMYGYAVRGNEWWADAEAVLTALAGEPK